MSQSWPKAFPGRRKNLWEAEHGREGEKAG